MRGTALIVITVGVITAIGASPANHGLVQREDIMTIYEESGSDQGAPDKAINRWLKGRADLEEGWRRL